MKIRSILFNDHMVRAVLQGRKTVARFAVEGAAAVWVVDFRRVESDQLAPHRIAA